MHLSWLESWYFLRKMAERHLKSGMVTRCKIKRLKMIYRGKSGKTGKKSEILESKYPMYAWRKWTLARMLRYFDIKFMNYEVNKKLWDARWNLYHTSSTKCKSRSSKVWTVKNTHRLSAWYDKNLAWLWACCLFVPQRNYLGQPKSVAPGPG